MDNLAIAERIKSARKERGMTQKDLAAFLDKTAATLSDIERGKIQVNAVDLYIISQKLGKPLEYFFGLQYQSKEIEDLIGFIQSKPPEEQAQDIEMFKVMYEMKNFQDIVQKRGEENIPEELISQVIQNVLKFADAYEDQFMQIFQYAKVIREPFMKGDKVEKNKTTT